MKVLLAEPDFPIPNKSKNHKNFLPIGLLKLASLYRQQGHKVKLIRGHRNKAEVRSNGDSRWCIPDEILITSLFTYWADHVKQAVKHYRMLYPTARISVGGIYASLMPDHCKAYTGCDKVIQGIVEEAEQAAPAYDLLDDSLTAPIDYQIIHTSRGCVRSCSFCGTWIIEPNFSYKTTIREEIIARNIVFYDNNLLANPHIADILNELIALKKDNTILWCEAQSGFDGRILQQKPHIANMLKKAGFRNIRIAWDGSYDQHAMIENQISTLSEAGFSRSREIYVFVLYNWDIPFEEMEQKRIKCAEWNVQISDCRYRPLDQTYDHFDFSKAQTSEDYFIHPSWSDELVKQYDKNVRRQNICVRHRFIFYSKEFERKKIDKQTISRVHATVKSLKSTSEIRDYLNKFDITYWLPSEVTYPPERAGS
ncbi:MAG: cobalamin-dependent protein [Halobacteriota archaeon]